MEAGPLAFSPPPNLPPMADEPVRLSPYDPAWPERFEAERALLEEAIGDHVTGGIHHVGSTAVAGLEAKPIIDVLAGVADLESSRAAFEPLARLGYLHAPCSPSATPCARTPIWRPPTRP
jgi:GrpB-like predicted nucleotidyltransferase (UPF0157 family)